ncbi:MAG: 3-hydroxyacyl-CoA dehydrogenase NAD-binding domain-containing protein, partial [Pseudomonadota bacterium]
MDINRIAVIGAGLMGAGIAQIAAQSGYSVNLMDVEQRFLDKGLSTIGKNLARMAEKGKMSQADAETVRGRITATLALSDAVGDADIIIEAVIERMDLKKNVWTEMEASAKDSAVFASNTSALSITELASVTKRPERFIGMHFFNPVP